VRSLEERARGTGVQIVAIGRPDLDLAAPAEAISDALAAIRPDAIISAAAYTQVDKAESEPDLAFAVNESGARALAKAARELGVPIVHLSTDYVFDGSMPDPYVETDPTGPTGVYGASKLAGEHAVVEEQPNSAILRTAWVYSPFGSNFVKTMLRLAETRDEIGVVGDQVGNPTSALDIADAIIAVTRNLIVNPEPQLRGIFHMTGVGSTSWAGFAEAIFVCSAELGGPSARVKRIGTADYPTPAKRPANSRLDCSKLAATHGVRLPDWHESLKQVVGNLVAVNR
jgi:dTDP-4-dehydrorhamnose reductase